MDPLWACKPWYYLSGFYSKTPGSGTATQMLQAAIRQIGEPIILCCEPILGTHPRSLTAKTEHLDPEARSERLKAYYRKCFAMNYEVPTHCTLRTELVGQGRRWSEPDRTFMWSMNPLMVKKPAKTQTIQHHGPPMIPSREATSNSSRERRVLLQGGPRTRELREYVH